VTFPLVEVDEDGYERGPAGYWHRLYDGAKGENERLRGALERLSRAATAAHDGASVAVWSALDDACDHADEALGA
jgi:hypothetical protein